MKLIRLAAGLAACAGGGCAGDSGRSTDRISMVRDQLESRGIADRRVLAAMRKVPRHEFVPDGNCDRAYEDRPLPIGWEQTISQPYIVAFMSEALNLRRDDRVLEVGTGSGYQAAVLAELAGEVYTIEIVEPLGLRAAETLKRTGYGRVRTRIGDGYGGWPEAAPFDAIIVTCAPDNVPEPLIAQLAADGRIIIPVGPAGHPQQLIVLRRQGTGISREEVLAVSFVPMTRDRGEPPVAR